MFLNLCSSLQTSPSSTQRSLFISAQRGSEVGAAYTANLATFLIVHQTASTSLSSFEEAKQQNAKVCARMEWSIGEFLRDTS